MGIDKFKHELPEFEERLDSLRGNMTNTEFADKLDVSRQSVGAWLNGEKTPDLPRLINIAKKCNVTTDWLLGLAPVDVKTTDVDMQKMIEYTGLSEDALLKLNKFYNRGIGYLSVTDGNYSLFSRAYADYCKQFEFSLLNEVIESESFEQLVFAMHDLKLKADRLSEMVSKTEQFIKQYDNVIFLSKTFIENERDIALEVAKEITHYDDKECLHSLHDAEDAFTYCVDKILNCSQQIRMSRELFTQVAKIAVDMETAPDELEYILEHEENDNGES